MIDKSNNVGIINLSTEDTDFFMPTRPLLCAEDFTVSSVEHRTGAFLLEGKKMTDYWKHREKRLSTHKKYRDKLRKEEPWIRKFWSTKQRCIDPNCTSYKRYGGRGIKFLLTKKELKILWLRDNAFSMKQPSIDRINNEGNYEFKNCRFIEMNENIRRERKPKKHFICYICKKSFSDYPSRDRFVCSSYCRIEYMKIFMIRNKNAKNKS